MSKFIALTPLAPGSPQKFIGNNRLSDRASTTTRTKKLRQWGTPLSVVCFNNELLVLDRHAASLLSSSDPFEFSRINHAFAGDSQDDERIAIDLTFLDKPNQTASVARLGHNGHLLVFMTMKIDAQVVPAKRIVNQALSLGSIGYKSRTHPNPRSTLLIADDQVNLLARKELSS